MIDKCTRALPWVLVMLAAGLILGLTLQDANGTIALSTAIQKFTMRIAQLMGASHGMLQSSWWSDLHYFRKLAHVPEYLLLGIAVMNCFKKKKYGWLKAAALCAGISLLDELLKGFLPSREFDWTDMPFDLLGYAVGIGVVMAVGRIWNHSTG